MAAPMTVLGVGPAIVLPGYLYAGIMSWALRRGCCVVSGASLERSAWLYIGWILITVGLAIIAVCLAILWRARGAGQLVTSGVFGLCRNPMYATQIALIMPGMAAAVGNLLVLGSVPLTWMMFAILIRIEERALEDAFGEKYCAYRRKVPTLVPRIRV